MRMNSNFRLHTILMLLAFQLMISLTAIAQVPVNERSPLGMPPQDTKGAQLYADNCSYCHSNAAEKRAPYFTTLVQIAPRGILSSMETGRMQEQAKSLSVQDRKTLVSWLTGKSAEATVMPQSAFCDKNDATTKGDGVLVSGWGGNTSGTAYVDATTAGITVENIDSLKLKWAFGFPDASESRSRPAVTKERVFVGSHGGVIYALDRESGCLHWQYDTYAGIRSAIVLAQQANGRRVVLAVDNNNNMYALDAVTGSEVWSTATASHSMASNTGSPTVALGKIFIPQASFEILAAPDDTYECCHTAGGVVALDLQTGKILWRFRTIAEPAKVVGTRDNGTRIFAPSGAPVWSSPTADPKRGLLYIGTGENFTRPTTDSSDSIIALDMNTGKQVWSFQGTAEDGWTTACSADPGSNCPAPAGPDLDFGMAPMLVTQPSGKQVLVVGQKSGVVHALDPDNKGKVLWQTRLGRGSNLGGIHWGMASDGVQAYATVNDPVNPDDHGIAPDNEHPLANGIFALDVSSGKEIWSTLSDTSVCEKLEGCLARYSAAPAAVPGLVSAGDLNGMVRIFSSNNGKLLWEYDTNVEFETVNGVSAHGGSIDGPSPVIADGMLITNSGYLLFGQKPGNVLLAFEVEK